MYYAYEIGIGFSLQKIYVLKMLTYAREKFHASQVTFTELLIIHNNNFNIHSILKKFIEM